jgi:hypothetical protein
MKKIVITFNKQHQLSTHTENVNLEEFIELTLSATLALMQQTLNRAPDEHRQQLESYIFDQFNVAASTTLAQFSPTIMKEDQPQ